VWSLGYLILARLCLNHCFVSSVVSRVLTRFWELVVLRYLCTLDRIRRDAYCVRFGIYVEFLMRNLDWLPFTSPLVIFFGPSVATTRNSCSSSTCAWYRPHTVAPDVSIVWSPSTRPMLDHPQCCAPSLLLLARSSLLPGMTHLSPTHHETNKYVSPLETDSRVEPPKFFVFKFEPRQINYSSQIKLRY
jgi:hypothetical protein